NRPVATELRIPDSLRLGRSRPDVYDFQQPLPRLVEVGPTRSQQWQLHIRRPAERTDLGCFRALRWPGGDRSPAPVFHGQNSLSPATAARSSLYSHAHRTSPVQEKTTRHFALAQNCRYSSRLQCFRRPHHSHHSVWRVNTGAKVGAEQCYLLTVLWYRYEFFGRVFLRDCERQPGNQTTLARLSS